MISFTRATRDGWRYSVSWRTRKCPDLPGYWELQTWNEIKGWDHVCYVGSYAAARFHAAKWDAEQRAALGVTA